MACIGELLDWESVIGGCQGVEGERLKGDEGNENAPASHLETPAHTHHTSLHKELEGVIIDPLGCEDHICT